MPNCFRVIKKKGEKNRPSLLSCYLKVNSSVCFKGHSQKSRILLGVSRGNCGRMLFSISAF